MKVSVCIPTYNQALYLEKAIRSAYEQTKIPDEIIVSNDCSTDNTSEVLRKLCLEIPILKVVNQARNLGMNRNTDGCLRMALNELIVKLDSDDYLAPSYIQKLFDQLVKYPEAGYAHASVYEINDFDEVVKVRKLYRRPGFQSSLEALKASLKGYQVAANIIMFKREALNKVGYISSKTNFAEDYYLSASLAKAGFGNVYINEVLSYYRVWIDSGQVRQKRKLDEIVGIRKVFEEVIEPAYTAERWDLQPVIRSKESFACTQGDCLSWDVYTFKEKEELKVELKKLSSTPKALFVASMYSGVFGKSFSALIKLRNALKNAAKIIITS